MPSVELTDWIDDQSSANIIWYVKRLSGNDTLATGSNQAGPYVPKELLFLLFPSIERPEAENPDTWFDMFIDSHSDFRTVRAVWYNGRVRGTGTRNEARLTGFGGASSPLLDPENTGSLAIFAFSLNESGGANECHVWVCEHETEADIIEEKIGPTEPGKPSVWVPVSVPPSWNNYVGLMGLMNRAVPRASCFLSATDIPSDWLTRFPTGATIVERAVSMSRCEALPADKRLLKRRKCEYEIFQSVEQAVFLPVIQQGFTSIEGFIRLAQSVLQSRKSRAGKSLELQAKAVFIEEGLLEGTSFSHNEVIEGGKRPDFLFPSRDHYENGDFPADRLRMLAVKTTCKDRWRQILNEATRIPSKHLLTVQEGVSEMQFKEMKTAGVTLVVPAALHDAFPDPVRSELMTLESFIADVQHLAG